MSAAALAAAAALAGAAIGWLARGARERKRLAAAQRTWNGLRAAQLGEYLSLVLFQLRDHIISAASASESIALAAKDQPELAERAERLRRLIGELNAKCARLLGDKSPITAQGRAAIAELDLAEFVAGCVEEARASFGAGAVPIAVSREADPGVFRGERRALRLALLAVLQNALQACEARGSASISVSLARRDGVVAIEVLDDGGGIADPHSAFEPLHSAKHGSQGLGLGLAVARRVLERAGGSIRLKTADGCTAALIELPAEPQLPVIRNEESTWAGRRSQA